VLVAARRFGVHPPRQLEGRACATSTHKLCARRIKPSGRAPSARIAAPTSVELPAPKLLAMREAWRDALRTPSRQAGEVHRNIECNALASKTCAVPSGDKHADETHDYGADPPVPGATSIRAYVRRPYPVMACCTS